jgi:hypothetical protein
VVLDFGEAVFEDPAAGAGFVLEVFECGEESAAEAWEELLGDDADELGGEELEGTGVAVA